LKIPVPSQSIIKSTLVEGLDGITKCKTFEEVVEFQILLQFPHCSDGTLRHTGCAFWEQRSIYIKEYYFFHASATSIISYPCKNAVHNDLHFLCHRIILFQAFTHQCLMPADIINVIYPMVIIHPPIAFKLRGNKTLIAAFL